MLAGVYMTKKPTFLISILTYLSISSVFAGHLIHPDFNKAESRWQSFNRKKFVLCKIKNKKRKPQKIVHKVKVHFENNSIEIANKEQEKILNGFEKYFTSNVKHVEIIGNADIRGSEDYNLRLSHARLNEVIAFINQHRRTLFTHSFNLKTDYKGERNSTAHQRKDRVVEIRFIETKQIVDKINRIYLVDGSYSMKKRRTVTGYTFDDLRAMNIPRDTVVYVVRDNIVGCAGENLRNYRPEGRTFVREAMGLFAYNMRGRIKFVTFTDGIEELSPNDESLIEQFIEQSKTEQKVRWYVR